MTRQTLKISMEMNNAAFEDDWRTEAARILQDAAFCVERRCTLPFIMFDQNGNRVGLLEVEEEA